MISSKSKDLGNHVAKISNIPKRLEKRMMKNHVIHDFVCMLIVFNEIVTSEMITMHTMHELYELIDIRFKRNSSYFDNNIEIKENFRVAKYVVDHFVDNVCS